MPSKQDPLARLRSLDPALTFHEGDDSAEASAVFRQTVGTGPPSQKRLTRALSVHRLAALAAVLVFAWLVLPAFAIGPGVVHLLVDRACANCNSGQRIDRSEWGGRDLPGQSQNRCACSR